MNNNGNNRFLDGFLLGAVIGALGVYLFGTKSGKNLIKIISERGLDGLHELIEEYDLEGIKEEIKEDASTIVEEIKIKTEEKATGTNNHVEPKIVLEKHEDEVKVPKKRFFKRFKK